MSAIVATRYMDIRVFEPVPVPETEPSPAWLDSPRPLPLPLALAALVRIGRRREPEEDPPASSVGVPSREVLPSPQSIDE